MRLAIVGATGKIGQAFIALLEGVADRVKPSRVHAVASSRSAGETIKILDKNIQIEALDQFDFSQVDCAFFALNHTLTKQYIPLARQHCQLVIDNSSAYRLDPEVPLIVPEVNMQDWLRMGKPSLIANPNCSTVQLVVALHPIRELFGLKRVDVATYQSISGAGSEALQDFAAALQAVSHGDSNNPLDVVPVIDSLLDSGMTKEEMKMHHESRKIWGDDALTVQATCVRVPVRVGHAEAVHGETRQAIDWPKLKQALYNQPGLTIHDEARITPRLHGEGSNGVHIARLRADLSEPNRLSLWVVADNMRKGGAFNALQIYEQWVAFEKDSQPISC